MQLDLRTTWTAAFTEYVRHCEHAILFYAVKKKHWGNLLSTPMRPGALSCQEQERKMTKWPNGMKKENIVNPAAPIQLDLPALDLIGHIHRIQPNYTGSAAVPRTSASI
jgi:hypothetical protein